ncbi:MAG: hypothetical protein HQK81_03855 [Desulfovibrionaceae bacterium]|nr:hypothetical protein [Desulfovibrionaceae bacterium]MBF0513178.1 hypothetical protein [Desulfovibrionaceae bacterium]
MSPEQEAQLKQAIYDKIPERRKKYIEKVGYANWDPFQKPQDPIDIRLDETNRTAQQLMREFLQARPEAGSNEYNRGAWELCLGVIGGSQRFVGMFDFCNWYRDLLAREDKLPK